MNSKTILKRILPIIIALFVVIIVTIGVALASKDKRVPTFASDEYGEEAYFTYEYNGVKIEISRDKVYESLRGTSSAVSDTVSNLVNIIDNDLLSEYVSKADEEDVWDVICNDIFSKTFDEYVKDNEKDFRVAAKKENKTYEVYLKEQIEDLLEDYVKNSKLGGVNVALTDFTYIDSDTNKLIVAKNEDGTSKLDDDGNEIYLFKTASTSDIFKNALIEVARTDYARVQIEKEYLEDLEEYNQYLADLEIYENYTEALADYEEDLEDWKNADKSTRGDKPVKPSKKDYSVTEAPDEVDAPVLVESDFESLYTSENYNKYNAILIPYATNAEAENALLQKGVVVAYKTTDTSGTTKYAWFHYGTTDFASATEAQKAEIEAYDYTTKGNTSIITDNDYYRLLTLDSDLVDENDGIIVASSASPDPRTGAYQLSEDEIQALIIELYNQFYQNDTEKQLVLNTDYTIVDGDIVLTDTGKEKTAYDEGELTTLGLYSSSTSNRFNKFSTTAENSFDDVYTGSIISASSLYYLYLITNKEELTDWEDYLDDANYYDTQFYTKHLAELLDEKNTATYTKNTVAELRNDNGLLIYDAVIEASYMSTYTSDYEATKKSSKNVIASYKVDGNKKEITVEDLFTIIAGKNGIITSYDSFQYEWVFLSCAKEDGTLFNTYFDYQAYKDGKKYSKCFLDNDDATELKDGIETYIDNLKNSFSSGYLESSGYPATYGWNNFIKDYFGSYGASIKTLEDVRVYLIYREIVSDYMEYLSKVDETTWDELYLTYVAKTMSTYINTTGIHTLISISDEDGNMIDPVNWTDAQVTAAKDLYDQILNLVKVVPTDKISTVLNALSTTFAAAPLLEQDGSTPNYQYSVDAIDGTTYNYDLFDYNYNYYIQGVATPVTVECSKFKTMGFALTTEDLTVTAGTMVTEFEDAVRQIWNNQLSDLVTGETVNKVVVYDHTYNPTEYKSDDTVVNYTGTTGYLVTEFGFHVYANQTSSMSSYFTTDSNNDKVFIGIPSRIHALMYVYENTKSSEVGYRSFSTLYTRYEEAVEDENTTEIAKYKDLIMKVVTDELELDMSFDDFYVYLKEYADEDTSAYVSTQLSTWFTSYTSSDSSSSSTFTLMYYDLSSSSYYQLAVMQDAIKNMANFSNIEENNTATLQEVLEYYVESYYNSFTTATFISGSKDDVEELLKAINYLDDYNIFVNNADKLLTSGYTAEKEALTKAFNSLKTYATNAYNNLSATDKAELNDLAISAGIID